MNEIKGLRIYASLVFILFLLSMGIWVGWLHKSLYMGIVGVVTIIYGYSQKMYDFNKRNLSASFILYLTYIFISVGFSERVVFTQIPSYLIPFVSVLCVRDNYKSQILQSITKWYAYLMGLSMILFVLCNIVHLPSLGTLYHDNENYGGFANYIFYVQQLSGSFRFNGPFLEPGHLGMIGAFILMANNFQIKNKYSILILISIALSLSLAGYMLVFVGYVFCAYHTGKLKIGRVVMFVTFLLTFVVGAQTYNNGDNIINENIISRFESDEERGFAGNNRASYTVMLLFENVLEDRQLLLYGYDRQFQQDNEDMFVRSNGLVFFIVKHGIIGVLITFMFYAYLAVKAEDKRFATLFFLYIFICFFQRTYYNWIPWILCYDYAIIRNDIIKN